MKTPEQIQETVMSLFDGEVRDLGSEEYRETLENVISDLEARLDCVKDEMAAADEDED